MNIAIYNKKGGVGKTSIAYLLSKELNRDVITNDDSIIIDILKAKKLKKDSIVKEIRNKDNLIIDLGGFVSEGLGEILSLSDIILMPTDIGLDSFEKTAQTFKDLKNDIDKIILIVNEYRDNQDIDTAVSYIKEYCSLKHINYFKIKFTTLLENIMQEEISLKEYLDAKKIRYHSHKNVLTDINYILKELKSIEDAIK